MSFKPDHELHKRRFSRNAGLGLVLVLFVALVYELTRVKVGENGIEALPHTEGDG
jgi:thiol:disulfide interchange protein